MAHTVPVSIYVLGFESMITLHTKPLSLILPPFSFLVSSHLANYFDWYWWKNELMMSGSQSEASQSWGNRGWHKTKLPFRASKCFSKTFTNDIRHHSSSNVRVVSNPRPDSISFSMKFNFATTNSTTFSPLDTINNGLAFLKCNRELLIRGLSLSYKLII